jgi:hypothetical protein
VTVSCDDGLCANLANPLLLRSAFPVLQAPGIGLFDGIVIADCKLSDAETVVQIPQQGGRLGFPKSNTICISIFYTRKDSTLIVEKSFLSSVRPPSVRQSFYHSHEL